MLILGSSTLSIVKDVELVLDVIPRFVLSLEDRENFSFVLALVEASEAVMSQKELILLKNNYREDIQDKIDPPRGKIKIIP